MRLPQFDSSSIVNQRFSEALLEEIATSGVLNIWVPKIYGGLDLCFAEGLTVLQDLARRDGSLGWTITLCSGAHYFARNMQPQMAQELFSQPYVFLGGSGAVGGTAEKTPDGYELNGSWTHATGSLYLSHFTLNAQVTENGIPCMNDENEPIIRSFIVPKEQVTICPSWPFKGMQATKTYAFNVSKARVSAQASFVYDVFYTQNLINHIPFRWFADATLMVNYLGMAEHFAQEAKKVTAHTSVEQLLEFVALTSQKIGQYAEDTEQLLRDTQTVSLLFQQKMHSFCKEAFNQITHLFLEVYLACGMKAAKEGEPLQRIFNDFYTATQHAIFR